MKVKDYFETVFRCPANGFREIWKLSLDVWLAT